MYHWLVNMKYFFYNLNYDMQNKMSIRINAWCKAALPAVCQRLRLSDEVSFDWYFEIQEQLPKTRRY